MGMEVKGMREAIAGFDKLKDVLPDEVGKGVDKSTRLLMRESQKEVPKKTTALQQTAQYIEHQTTGPKRSRGVRYGEPGEGDGVIDYAAAVHEILDADHAPPTKAKYVEGPLLQGVRNFKRFLSESCERAVRRAFR